MPPEPKTEAEEKKDKEKDDARVVDKDDKPARLWLIEPRARRCAGFPGPSGGSPISNGRRGAIGCSCIAAEHPEPLVWRERDSIDRALRWPATKEIAAPRAPSTDLKASPDGKFLSYLVPAATGRPCTIFHRPLLTAAALAT